MKIAIYGYGNLARGVEIAVKQNPDTELVGVFTRRPPERVKTVTDVPTIAAQAVTDYIDQIDVLVICGGSATDLPRMTPELARHFNVVDSFDTHQRITEHFARVDTAAKEGGRVALISAGWDPGIFSVIRAYTAAMLPVGSTYTFWGRGVSQGHSDAVRRIDGVLDARQYTVPNPSALQGARSGSEPNLSVRDKHRRECYVVAKEGAELDRIEREIKTMPDYFSDYDTTVKFISEDQLRSEHSSLSHGGTVIRTGHSGLYSRHTHTAEFSIKLDSNPEFTGMVLICAARAVYKMAKSGIIGCKTMLDIPPADYSAKTREELIGSLL